MQGKSSEGVERLGASLHLCSCWRETPPIAASFHLHVGIPLGNSVYNCTGARDSKCCLLVQHLPLQLGSHHSLLQHLCCRCDAQMCLEPSACSCKGSGPCYSMRRCSSSPAPWQWVFWVLAKGLSHFPVAFAGSIWLGSS